MSDDNGQNAKEAARRARDERLAAALRANLRRRKAGARRTAESPKSPPSTPEINSEGDSK